MAITKFSVEKHGKLIKLRRYRKDGTEAEPVLYTMTSLRALIPMWEMSPSDGPDSQTIEEMEKLMQEIEGK